MVTRSVPWNTTLPRLIRAGGLNSWAIAKSRVDFPQPDSPTTPTNSPRPTSRSTPSTARTEPAGVSYTTWRSRTVSTTPPPHRTQGRVADLVERVVEQGERRTEQPDADAGRDRPQWNPGLQRLLVLRPVEHRAPAVRRRVAEAQELQPGGGEHRVERRAEEVRNDERGHRGQDLEDDDVRASFTTHPGRFEELAVAQRQRLRAELVGPVRPAGDDQHDQHDQQ